MNLASTTARWLMVATTIYLLAPAGTCVAREQEGEIVANLAGGRVILQVTKDNIVFAAIDQPLEAKSTPPRVLELDSTHIGVLLGASEWQLPAEPKPVRLDHDFRRLMARDPRYQVAPGEAEPDLELIGVAFLERLRPLVSQLHHKIDMSTEEPLLQVVVIGYAPNNYGPEVWLVEFHIEQEEIAFKGDYWQTRLQRPRFTQLYPPEKHAPRTLLELRYPQDLKGPTLLDLIRGNDPRVARLRGGDQRFAKVLETIEKGQAHKVNAVDAVDFLRAALPLLAGNSPFVLATMEEQHGFTWIVPPDEPMEKATEDKDHPPDAPTLRRKPKP
jgi:hypothetical protein